ncbi:glycoside hydrolase family 104 protein [Halomonas sp. NO4]|uniref:glycoside hydrolase family 24 protein n=1 Tax=Halomonas sp. NO4 TaxID=2484813 RepID=UPI0013D6A16D|nr:glycoside hydrolase family 104 protein [Halomonas sp. NO4]
MPSIRPQDAGGHNVCAFLDMIAWAEIGRAMLDASDDGYDVLVGSTPNDMAIFKSYDDHPLAGPDAAIEYRQGLLSTAAGRYQILYRFWKHYQGLLGLKDFSPVYQDMYAIRQLEEQGAMGHVKAGRIRRSIDNVANIWASLPGAGYGQHERDLAELLHEYRQAKGRLDDEDWHWYEQVAKHG